MTVSDSSSVLNGLCISPEMAPQSEKALIRHFRGYRDDRKEMQPPPDFRPNQENEIRLTRLEGGSAGTQAPEQELWNSGFWWPSRVLGAWMVQRRCLASSVNSSTLCTVTTRAHRSSAQSWGSRGGIEPPSARAEQLPCPDHSLAWLLGLIPAVTACHLVRQSRQQSDA